MEELRKYITNHKDGYVSSKVVVKNGPIGRGLFTLDKIYKNELVFSIPNDILISQSDGLEILKQYKYNFDKLQLKLPSESYLAIYLAFHLNNMKKKFNKTPYTTTLPTLKEAYSFFPLFWNSTKLKEAIDMNEFFVKNERNVNNDYNVIQKHVKLLQKELKQEYEDIKLGFTIIDNPLFTLEEYIYGWSMVNSRNFFVQNSAYINGGRAVLVPFGDLMNHGGNNDEKLQWKFNEEKNTLDFISCKDIIYEMEELLINYSGEYSGVEPLKQFPPFHFFIFYGFLEEQQPLLIEQSKL